MRHLLVVVIALAGCAFEPGPFEDDEVPVDEEPIEPEMPPGGEPDPAMTPCSVTGAKLCVEFDHAAMWTRDATGIDVTASNVTREMSDLGYAVLVDDMSQLLVAESPTLDIRDAITFEMWIYADTASLGSRSHLLDNDNQYAMSITDAMNLRCGIEGFTIDSDERVLVGWHHVACTYDRSRLRVYVDGNLRGCRSEDQSIPTDGNDGTVIGAKQGSTLTENFSGKIDNVHVYDRRLSGDELCTLAGASGCTDQCPSGNRGD